MAVQAVLDGAAVADAARVFGVDPRNVYSALKHMRTLVQPTAEERKRRRRVLIVQRATPRMWIARGTPVDRPIESELAWFEWLAQWESMPRINADGADHPTLPDPAHWQHVSWHATPRRATC